MKHNTSLFSAVSQEAQSVLNHFDEIIRQTRPINSKQFQQLPRDIKQLFHYLEFSPSDHIIFRDAAKQYLTL